MPPFNPISRFAWLSGTGCFVAALAWFAGGLPLSQEQAAPPGSDADARVELEAAFAANGLAFDLEGRWCSVPVDVEITEDLLEYLLVGPAGAAHEALFSTEVMPSILNTALLALGAERGSNARWFPKDPPPSEEELANGASPVEIVLPTGTGFFLYAGWRVGDEVYFFRVEDLVRNLATGQSMRRHAWVYLGSAIVPHPSRPGEETFAADIYRNLINVSFFGEGYTLLTAAIEECLEQTIWIANTWLTPPRGTRVALVFSRDRLEACPLAIVEELPVYDPSVPLGDFGR